MALNTAAKALFVVCPCHQGLVTHLGGEGGKRERPRLSRLTPPGLRGGKDMAAVRGGRGGGGCQQVGPHPGKAPCHPPRPVWRWEQRAAPPRFL